MRLLFLLLWRNNFTILFLLLQGVCVYLLIENTYFQKATILNATNAGVATAMQGVSYVKEYISLRDNNEQLAAENARLRTSLNESLYNNTLQTETVKDTIRLQQYSYIVAKVINNSINHRNNYLTLDRGSNQGIQPEMGVINSQGVVGIVKQVSNHFCTVMSLLHKDTRISAMIKRNKFFGSLTWDGNNPTIAILNEIDKTVPVLKGDTIVTTSYSSIFPAGIMIGTVLEAKQNPGFNFHQITVKLSTRFDDLTNVYVIDNLLKNEQKKLESANQSDDK